jgi:crotonobetainyl-CoA:carnitine CoA-transferase CaiB-like acyl-CoA transferase
MSKPSASPFGDVRILAIEQYGAGPWATMQLADLGAEVIKIEDPASGGDIGRYVPPYQEGEDSLFFETFNGGKRSISLDLRKPAGQEVLGRLVANADALFSNLRGDQPARLGLRYADLAKWNERIVCCSLSGYGQDGPRSAAGALDYVIQGYAGWMTTTGEPGSPPTRTGPSLVDFSGGYAAAISLLGALWRARRDGVGADCDVSLQETALQLLSYLGTWTATAGYVPERRPASAHATIVPFQNFATSDGWIVVACPKQVLWERLCLAISRHDLRDDLAYADMTLRNENRATLIPELEATFRQRSSATWITALDQAGVPVGPINDVPSALRDEQILARQAIQSYEHPRLGTVRRVRSALRVDEHTPHASPAPSRGEHTREVATRVAGITDAEFESYRTGGAFGDL